MNFENCVEIVLKHEGLFSDCSLDPGSTTKFGISKRAYPNLNIQELTIEKATAIYRMDYWDRMRCEMLPAEMRLMVFDCAVNQGVSRSSIYLQKCAGVHPDGVLGPITMNALKGINPEFAISKIAKYRLDAYTKNPRWNIFGAGWASRLLDITIKSFMFSNAISLAQVRS